MAYIDFPSSSGEYEGPEILTEPGTLNEPNADGTYGDGGSRQGITDPPFTAGPSAAGGIGAGIPWLPGASRPSSSPPGYHWDANFATFVEGDEPAAAGAGRTDRNAIAAKVAQWAGMAGADPSLGSNPEYWIRRILETGGLGPDNEKYWQDAGVGPSAFFRNPNRESGGPSAAGNPGGYTDASSLLYLNQLMQRLTQANKPQDNSLLEMLKSLAMARIKALDEPPYSAADEQALITKYRDPLTQARDASYGRNKEQASQRGFLPSSGLLRQLDSNTDQGYERGIAQGANDMAVRAIELKQKRAQEQLQILSSLIGATYQSEDRFNTQGDHAVDLAKMFPDFDSARLDQLLRASGDSGSSSALQALMALANQNFNTQGANNAADQANSGAWGKLIAWLLDAMGRK